MLFSHLYVKRCGLWHRLERGHQLVDNSELARTLPYREYHSSVEVARASSSIIVQGSASVGDQNGLFYTSSSDRKSKRLTRFRAESRLLFCRRKQMKRPILRSGISTISRMALLVSSVVGQERQFGRHINIATPPGRIVMNSHTPLFVERVLHQGHKLPGEGFR